MFYNSQAECGDETAHKLVDKIGVSKVDVWRQLKNVDKRFDC